MNKMSAVGALVPIRPASQARKCAECGRLAYFSKETLDRLNAEEPGEKHRFICIECIPTGDLNIVPYNASQIAQIHQAGIDMSADQINQFVKDVVPTLPRRKP